MAQAVLERLNFLPIVASDGVEALVQATEHRADLRAIITDMQMPHLDGLGFVRACRRLIPNVPVIVSSGRLDDATAQKF